MHSSVGEGVSLLELRSWIISRQLVVNLHLFQQRSRLAALSMAENKANPVSYNATFASLILRYAAKCIASINEQIAILQVCPMPPKSRIIFIDSY
jgi:hypothetical protein